jgi:peroxiredoxin
MKTGIVILAAAFALFAADIHAQQARIGEQAPDFTLTDSNGETHSLSDFAGKIVVLEWVNNGCPFVAKHYDTGNMQDLQEELTDEGVVWLSVCSSAPGKQGHMSADAVNEWLDDQGSNATAYLIDEDGEVGKRYGAKTTPHMYVIDADGALAYAGAIDDQPSTDHETVVGAENHVANAVDALANGEEPETKVSKPYGCSVKYK